MKKYVMTLLIVLFSVSLWAKNWWKDAVFYEVFVRSFYDSDGNGIGDLRGLTEKLNYLNDGNPQTHRDLGVDALWLMPIFKSSSYHGYDISDYYKINRAYGTMSDFTNLISEAHKRGIKIILDLVINHTSRNNPWFYKSRAKEKPYTDYYVWKKKIPAGDWGKPWGGGNAGSVWSFDYTRKEYYYSVFGSGMPDLNFRSAALRAEIKKIAKFWLDKGVDGFRLDAARYIIEDGGGKGQADTPETLAWWREFESYIRGINSNAMTVGEVWASNDKVSKYYQNGKGLDACFNFELAQNILSFAGYGNAKRIRKVLKKMASYGVPFSFYAPFLSNHDQIRVMNVLRNNIAAAKLAAAVYLSMPGPPFVYYGEEIGMSQQNGGNDALKRTPMQWNSTRNAGFTTGKRAWTSVFSIKSPFTVQSALRNGRSLLKTYQKLILLRHQYPALSSDTISLFTNQNKKFLIYSRGKGKHRIWFVGSGSKNPQEGMISKFRGKTFVNLMTGRRMVFRNGRVRLKSKEFYLLLERK